MRVENGSQIDPTVLDLRVQNRFDPERRASINSLQTSQLTYSGGFAGSIITASFVLSSLTT